MALFMSIGVFAAAFLLMAAMLFRKHMLLGRGVVFAETRGGEHAPLLFSVLHDLERALLHLSSRFAVWSFLHLRGLTRRGVRIVAERTPAKKIVAAVSGKKEVNGERTEPSAYLKDITKHRDQLRENSSRE